MKIVVIGLTLSSSWGNGHATTYRALLKALASRGHDILFLECDRPWYAETRDLPAPPYCTLAFYDEVADLGAHSQAISDADLVVVGSYVVDGAAVARLVRPWSRRLAFYDIDTPITLANLEAGAADYITRDTIPLYDLYLSFTGGPTLRRLEREFGARRAEALFCAVDPALHHPPTAPIEIRWDLGYLGTYSDDRQPALERLLLEPARRAPQRRFVVAGPQYPACIRWPDNVARIEHLAPTEHAAFYAAQRWTLNVTRADMIAAGHSPSVRLFEASACGTPVISDFWEGLGDILQIGREMLVARSAGDVTDILARSPAEAAAIGRAACARILSEHTAAARAIALERMIAGVKAPASVRQQGLLF